MLLCVSVIVHTFFGEATVPPIFPTRPRYLGFPRASRLARQVPQLLATNILVMTECPKVARRFRSGDTGEAPRRERALCHDR